MSDNFQPPKLFTPTTEAPGEQEKVLQDPSFNANAIDSTSDNTKPGVFPGSYPAVETPLHYPAASAIPGMAQTAYQTAQGALQTVNDTVKPYLPESMASYLPGTTTEALQSQQSVQTSAPQDTSVTSGITSSLHNTTLQTPSPYLPPASNPVLEDAAYATDKTTAAAKSGSQAMGQTLKTTTVPVAAAVYETAAPVANAVYNTAGSAARTVQGAAATVGSTIAEKLPESVGQYFPGRDTHSLPIAVGHQTVPSTDVAATSTIAPLTKPNTANTQTAHIAGTTGIMPLTSQSSTVVDSAEVANASSIEPFSSHLVGGGLKHTQATAVAPKKSTAVAPARVDLDSRPSQVAMTTGIEPLKNQDDHIVENTEVAGATNIAPLEKGTDNATHSKTATQHLHSAADRVQTAAQNVLPGSTHESSQHAHPTHHEAHIPLRSRSPAKGDQTAHPKATTGDNLHAPATTTITNNSRGIPHATTITHTKDDPAHKVLDREDDQSSDSTSKPKFMDRMRGEMKVIAGKVGGNEEKVEEGRRMMGKPQN